MVLWLVPNISGSGSDGGPVMQLTHRDGTAISVSYAVNRAVLWREDFHQTSPVQWQPDNSWKNGYLQRRIHFLLRWHDLSSVMENWDPFSEGPASAEDGQAMENWNPFEDPEMLELTGELAMESDDIDGLEAWLVQAKVMHLPWEKIQPKQEKLELLRSQKAFEPKKTSRDISKRGEISSCESGGCKGDGGDQGGCPTETSSEKSFHFVCCPTFVVFVLWWTYVPVNSGQTMPFPYAWATALAYHRVMFWSPAFAGGSGAGH
eukprot:symbB.v1.2.016767.t2/scaffold1288.1/size126514/8